MDQDSNVDPTNIVRADDKPDLETELPSRGTSQSIKTKFQAMESSEIQQVDFSQPVKVEKSKPLQSRWVLSPLIVFVQEAAVCGCLVYLDVSMTDLVSVSFYSVKILKTYLFSQCTTNKGHCTVYGLLSSLIVHCGLQTLNRCCCYYLWCGE